MDSRDLPRPQAAPTVPWMALALVGLIAAAIRLYVGIRYNLSPSAETIRGFQLYRVLAENLVEGRGYHWDLYGPKFANRPPGYPLLLAGTIATGIWPWGTLAVQSAIGGLATMLTGVLATRLWTPRAGVFAAIAVLGYPYSVLADTSLIEHGLLTVALLLVALAWRRLVVTGGVLPALLLGATLGAATMVRITATAAVPLILVSILVALPRGRRLRSAALVLAAAAAIVAPWVVRNARTVGTATLSTDTWRALWVGHNDHTLRLYPEQSIDDAERAAWKGMDPERKARILALADDEVAQATEFRSLATEWVADHPGAAVKGVFVKAWAFLSPVMNPPTAPPEWKGTAHTISWSTVFLAGAAGLLLLRRRWREWLVVVALYGGFLGAAMLTWGQSRFRAPLDVLMIAAAAVLADRLCGGKPNLAGPEENG